MIYGSGLRDGDANITTVPPYTQFNVGVAREFLWPLDPKPMTVRFDVINLFDTVYFIRNGSGIGVFAPAIRAAARLFPWRVEEILAGNAIRKLGASRWLTSDSIGKAGSAAGCKPILSLVSVLGCVDLRTPICRAAAMNSRFAPNTDDKWA